MLKRTCLFFIFVMLIYCSLLLRPSEALQWGDQEVDISVTNSYVSQYIWRGWDLHDNDGGYQPGASVSFPDLVWGIDLSMSWWASFPTVKGSVNATEMDYSTSLSKALTDDLKIGTGYTYYDYPKLNSHADVHEVWGSLTYTLPLEISTAISSTFWAGYNFPEESDGPENGWYFSWSLDFETPLPDWVVFQDDQTITYGVVTWHTDGVAGVDPAYFYAYDLYLGTSYSIGDHVSVSPVIHYVFNNEDAINTKDEFWAGVTLGVSF